MIQSIKKFSFLAAGAAILALGAAPASAKVFDLNHPSKDVAKAAKFASKQLADIGKQQSKYLACIVKATNKCRFKPEGDPLDCALDGWESASSQPKFQAAMQKCADKQDYNKKRPKGASDALAYIDMGCPGDADSTTPALEDFTSVTDWQAGDGLNTTFVQVDALAALVEAIEPDAKQQYKDVGTLAKYAAGIQKCMLKCETDVKGSKGGGGLTDDRATCDLNEAAASVEFLECTDKNTEKLRKKIAVGSGYDLLVIPTIDTAITTAFLNVFNKECGSAASPSGAFVDGSTLY